MGQPKLHRHTQVSHWALQMDKPTRHCLFGFSKETIEIPDKAKDDVFLSTSVCVEYRRQR